MVNMFEIENNGYNKSMVTRLIMTVCFFLSISCNVFAFTLDEITFIPAKPAVSTASSTATSSFSIDKVYTKLVEAVVTSDVQTTTYNNFVMDGDSFLDDVNVDPELIGDLLVYPYASTYLEGCQIGYKLSTDMPIEIRFYNTIGNELTNIRKVFSAGDVGGSSGYNKVSFRNDISAGLYILVLIHTETNNVLGKAKLIVLP